MRIEEHKHGAVSVVRPVGSIGGDDADVLRDTMSNAHRRSFGRALLDLSAVPVIDSRGLEALLDIADLMAETGQTLKVSGLQEIIREVTELTGVTPSLEVFDDANSAVRSWL